MTLFLIKTLNRLLFYLELFAAAGLFRKRLRPRKLWWARLLGCFAMVAGIAGLYCFAKDLLLNTMDTETFSQLFFWVSYLMTAAYIVLSIVLCGVTVYQVFAVRVSNAVFVSSVAFCMQSIADNILSLLLWGTELSGAFTIRLFAEPGSLLLYFAVYLTVYGLCYRLFIRSYQYGDEDFLTRKVMLVVIGISFVNVILGGAEPPQHSVQASQLFSFMLIARLLLGMLGLVMLFYLLKWAKLQFDFEKQEYILQQQRQQYEIAKESINTVNINAHDLRNQIAVIREAVRESGKGDRILGELNEMEKHADLVDTDFHTGNSALDIAVTEKARLCRSKSIQFSAILDGTALASMSDVDIYVLFGNALDNAIEAAGAIPDPEKRIISLSLRKEACGAVIHVENTFLTPPLFAGGVPVTRKEGAFHGYGTKSMISIAGKYGGNVRMYTKDDLFCLDCYIP